MARRQPLVCQHIENLSRTMLVKYLPSIGAYVRGRHGVYALYNRGRLYYVGLASNLPLRLRHHLSDRHEGAWDRFSVYLTIGAGHLRELESLVVRVAAPRGNRQRGTFARSEDLLDRLRQTVRDRHRGEEDELFGTALVRKPPLKPKPRATQPELARYVGGSMPLRARYKGKLIKARVRADGTIAMGGDEYATPSAAARAVVKRAVSGWDFWQCERAPGDWVRLTDLRR